MFQGHLIPSLPQLCLVSFNGEWNLENKMWMLNVLIAIGILLFPGPHGGQS